MEQPESNVLIDTAQNLKDGNLPSNQQATHIIEKTKQFLDQTKDDTRMDAKTIKVLSDAQELAEATKQFIENKNADEKVQKFVAETMKAGQEVTNQVTNEASEVASKIDTEKVKEVAHQTTNSTIEMIKILLRSGEFRTYLLDFSRLFQEILINDYEKVISSSGTKQDASTSEPPTQKHPKEENSLLQPGSSADMGTTTIVLAGSMGDRGFAPGEVQVNDDVVAAASAPQETATDQVAEEETKPEEDNNKWHINLPDDKIHEFSFRFLQLLRKIASNAQLKQGITYFNETLRDLIDEARQSNAADNIKNNEHLQNAFEHAKGIIAEFTGESVEDLFNSVKDLINSLREDEKMRSFITDIQNVFNDVVNQPELLEDYSFVKRSEELFGEGRRLMSEEEWRERFEHIFSQSSTLWESVKNDKHVQNLADKAQQFMDNFTYIDATGKRCLNQDLIGQMRHFIIPLFIDLLDKVPVPPIEGSNDTYDYKFENLTISGYDIIPDHIQFHTYTDFDLDVKRMKTSNAFTKVDMKISNIHNKMEGVHFWFDRKSFPKLEDRGTADVSIDGEGMNINIHFEISLEENSPTFTVSSVDIDIDQLNITIKEATHSFLLTIWSTIYQGTIKRKIAATLQEKIKTVFQTMESGFNNLLANFPSSRLLDVAKEHVIEGAQSILPAAVSPTKQDQTPQENTPKQQDTSSNQ